MFVGNNLTNIRILHGYTRKQLADRLQVSEQSVWQYENGYTTPKLEVINNLKRIFSVKSKYFFSEDFLDKDGKSNIDANHIAYRADVISSIQKTQSEAMHLEYLNSFLKIIEERIQYPPNEIALLRDKIIDYMNNTQDDRKTIMNKAASMARDFLELGPTNVNLLFVLEKKGAFILEKAIGEKIDAYSLWSKDNRPYIMLGSLKKSAARRNFDLAHELGHLLLHYKVEFTTLEKKVYRQYEKEADTFAETFLLPEKEFKKDFVLLSRNSNPDSYAELKKKWAVSIQTLAYRAHALGYIDYQKYRYFNIQLNKKGYKNSEPLDKQLKINRPGKIRSILELLLEEGYIELESLLDRLKVDVDFLSNLLGLDIEFFKKYENKAVKKFSVKDLNIKAK
ncbi:XRE family transcriptional regulator [Pullulanibacillus sp. KACC 23026]|uniref:spr1629 family repressor/antitoxin n=1 Tax=Pullulanibacillus sp. KACC 23026 TaxID=3028315 RepID=UPI0023B0A8B0|nr:XRE family transcriptional regulator [Pullulanibacillus sp. KACC 23026]WEG13310.1 XRE family transcriptional regulator [Pullulanibacillus sp. KACC 23026]